MKRTAWLAALALTACGSSHFTIDRDLAAQTVQGDPLGGLLSALVPAPFTATVDLKAEEQAHDTGPASHVYLEALWLAITPHDNPQGNFDFLDELHLYAAGANAPDQKTEVARKAPVPKGATRIDFDVLPGVDLLPMVNAGVQITTTATGRKPAQDTTIDGHLTLDVRI